MEQRGFFLIADITGYTTYLSESELGHAQQTLTELLELVVEHTRPPLAVAQLEGDAVLSYALEEGFVSAQTMLEQIETTYVEFRRAIDLMVLNNTCRCNACANVSALDLKFFVHHGSFAIQPVGDIRQLVGTDVNLIHRLMKNSVTAATGVQAYLLLTNSAVEALDIDPGAEGMLAYEELVPDFGSVMVVVKDMQPVYEAERDVERTFYEPEAVLLELTADIPLSIERTWNYANQSEFRNLLIGSDSFEVVDRKGGRVGVGSAYQCYHGNMTVKQVVLEWRPFERVVLQQLVPLPGKRPTRTIVDLRFTAIDGGTRFTETVSKPTGSMVQRSIARVMLSARRGQAQKDLEVFADQVVEHNAGQGLPDGASRPVSSGDIGQAAADSLHRGEP